MRYPTVVNYCDALRNSKNIFRTLQKVVVETDEMGDPIFRASSRSVRFNVKINNASRSLRMFTGKVNLAIDESCELLPCEVLVATDGGADYWDVVVESPMEIGKDGEDLPMQIYENRARFCKNDLYGYTDADGRTIIEPQYDYAEDFSESRAVVGRDGLFGLIDNHGNEIIKPIYDEISYDGSHLCYTDRNGKWGVIDRLGHIISDNQWDWVGEFSQGMLVVELGGQYGYINDKGLIVIDLKYDDATSFDHNGYATVTINGRSFKIDKEEFRV